MTWLRKYWGFLVTGFLLVLGFLFGVTLRRRSAPSPEPVKEREEARVAQETLKAAEVRDEEKKRAATEHSAKVAAEVRAEQAVVDPLREDPEALNQFLKDVGKKAQEP